MRAREFIVERKDFLPSQKAAIPGMQRFPQLDNSNPYHMWRFIVAAAGQGQNPNDTTEPARARTCESSPGSGVRSRC